MNKIYENYENCLFIGTVKDLHKVCIEGIELTADDFKSVKLPRYRSFDIKLSRENEMYYSYIHGEEIAVAKVDKLEKRILTTFEVFVYKNDAAITSFDIQIKKPREVEFFVNGQSVGSLVVCEIFHGKNAIL